MQALELKTGTHTGIWVQVLQLRQLAAISPSDTLPAEGSAALFAVMLSVCLGCVSSLIIVFMFAEKAREYLHKTGRFIVIGGIISPVHDSYGKPVSDAELSLCAGRLMESCVLKQNVLQAAAGINEALVLFFELETV